ncbi:MAG: insulinase family protein [Bdellovibrionaceae bacterium]|nr:insulinase family protein [Pseudobdellovibrionaceae bacterium]
MYKSIMKLVHIPTKVEKPEITPLSGVGLDNDVQSAFFQKMIKQAQSEKSIEYTSLETQKKVKELKIHPGVMVYTAENPYNDLAQLNVFFSVNPLQNKYSCLWSNYLKKSQTPNLNMVQLQRSLYSQGVSFDISCSKYDVSITLSGEEKFLIPSLSRILNFIGEVVEDQELLTAVVASTIDSREKNLSTPRVASALLVDHIKNGIFSDEQLAGSNQELKQLKSNELQLFKQQLNTSEKKVHYVGRKNANTLAKELTSLLPAATTNSDAFSYPLQRSASAKSNKNKIYILNTPGMAQTHLFIFRSLFPFSYMNLDQFNSASFYTYYLGGGMSSPFFKEIREKRALAYGTYAYLETPYLQGEESLARAFIGTQTDKLACALFKFHAIYLMNTYNVRTGIS